MENDNQLIQLIVHKEISSLYKSFLQTIEDLKLQHLIMLQKAKVNVDEKYLEDINYLTPQFFDNIRKRILDFGNDSERSLLNFLNYYDFTVNQEKIKEALSKQKTVKKVIINSPIEYNNKE